jgi:hypothetical protein
LGRVGNGGGYSLLIEVYRLDATLGQFLALLVANAARGRRVRVAGVSTLQSGAHQEVPVR